jgi:hypothetical protein
MFGDGGRQLDDLGRLAAQSRSLVADPRIDVTRRREDVPLKLEPRLAGAQRGATLTYASANEVRLAQHDVTATRTAITDKSRLTIERPSVGRTT